VCVCVCARMCVERAGKACVRGGGGCEIQTNFSSKNVEGLTALERARCTLEDVRVDFEETACMGIDSVQLLSFVNTVMNLREFLLNFLSS
jgi:hypothetical protein